MEKTMDTLIDEEEPVFKAFNFGNKLKVTAPSFSKKINQDFENQEKLVTNEKIINTEIKEVNEKTEIVTENALTYEEMFLKQAIKARTEYFNSLYTVELIILKQTIAKFIITPEFKTLPIKLQGLIKVIPESIKKYPQELNNMSKDEEAKFLIFLKKQYDIAKINKGIPQKIKDCTSFMFKAVQADYLLKYQD